MYAFLILNICFVVFVGVGCKKKKNNASKLKPRDMSKEKGVTKSPASKPGTPTTPTQEAEKVKTPEPEAEPPMAPREADDNETINEAPSQWSAIK